MLFIMLTVSITVAILLAGVISTVIMFKLMGNEKVVKWLMNYYMKQFENSFKAIENYEPEMGA